MTLPDLAGRTPLLLLLGYFHCRKLCSVLRYDVEETLVASGLVAGRDYTLAALSVDPEETPGDAARAKAESLARASDPGAQSHWRFLTGGRGAIESVARAVGFDYATDDARKTFTHPIGAVVIAPPGRVSDHLLGFGLDKGRIRTALARAAAGEISAPASPILLLCYDFDPATGRYSLGVMKALRLVAGAFVLVCAILMAGAARRRHTP